MRKAWQQKHEAAGTYSSIRKQLWILGYFLYSIQDPSLGHGTTHRGRVSVPQPKPDNSLQSWSGSLCPDDCRSHPVDNQD